VGPVVDGDARAAAFAGPDDEIVAGDLKAGGVLGGAVDVADGQVGAAAEGAVHGEEVFEENAGGAVEDFDARAAAVGRGGGDVVDAVAGEVAGGDAHAALKGVLVGQEVVLQEAGAGLVNADARRRA